MSVTKFISAEKRGFYHVNGIVNSVDIVDMAKVLIKRKFKKGRSITNPELVRDYLILHLAELEYESFCCLYLDNQHQVLQFESLFRGTINGASVYPREVVKRALALNASAMIFAHNHPSGVTEPSQADVQITRQLKVALNIFDVRVLDHFIVGSTEIYSFAENGLA